MNDLTNIPKLANGLTPPLRTLLESSELTKHSAMVALELEVLAKKFDRFGWDRDRGSACQDRMIRDWIDALVDFPLEEIQAACRAAVLSNPGKMPNEGHIRGEVMKARAKVVRDAPPPTPERTNTGPVSDEAKARVAKLVKDAGFAKRVVQ